MRQSELVGVWLAFAILTAVAVVAYRSADAAAATLGRAEHANAVLVELGEVMSAYARSSAARRAYVVAGDPTALADTAALDARTRGALSAVRASVADNAAQVRRVEALGALIDERIADLNSSVERRWNDGDAVETAAGMDLTARIRVEREAMEREENRLLTERAARTRRELATSKVTSVVGTLASLAILLFAFLRLKSEIARRRISARDLIASQAFLDSMIENIPDMIFVKRADDLCFERINRAGERLLGLSRAELVGKSDRDLFAPEQAAAFQARDREVMEGGVLVDIAEEPITTKLGDRWLHTQKVPIVDEHGVVQHLLGISEDITDRRAAAALLVAAKDAAEAANLELEAFSYSVAHDLRAPLRSIDGFSQAILEDYGEVLGDDGRAHLGRVRSAAQRMAQLIDGLLGLSRLTRGDFVRESVDVTHLAELCGARLQEANPRRHVELVVAEGLVADGDAALLTAAFDNLLGNAWKFTGKSAHPRVEVGAQVEDGQPVFFVRDNGAGFDPAYAHKLFGAFQRLHGAAEFEGTGIGLATVQRIVRRHGGRIRAEGEVGRGATFLFTLRSDRAEQAP